MRLTYLVEIDTDSTDLLSEAEDIKQDLLEAGHNVISTKPWSRSSLSPQPLGAIPNASAAPTNQNKP